MQQNESSACCSTTLSSYIAGINRRSVLVESEQQCRGHRPVLEGEDTVRELIETNLGFVVKVASEFRNRGLPFEDLINEGNLGLLKAAARFDATRGHHFTTYAVFWIRKAIMNALAEQTRVVRIPAYHRRQQKRFAEATQSTACNNRNGYRSDDEHSHGAGKISPYKDGQLRMRMREVSLDSMIFEDGNLSFADRLPDERKQSPEASLIGREIKQLIEDAIDNLPEQERKVIRYRFGLDGDQPWVLKQVGDLLGVSRERVRQIEIRAKSRMKKFIGCRFIASRKPR